MLNDSRTVFMKNKCNTSNTFHEATDKSVDFEGQMVDFMLSVVTTCSHEFVSLALLQVFA